MKVTTLKIGKKFTVYKHVQITTRTTEFLIILINKRLRRSHFFRYSSQFRYSVFRCSSRSLYLYLEPGLSSAAGVGSLVTECTRSPEEEYWLDWTLL